MKLMRVSAAVIFGAALPALAAPAAAAPDDRPLFAYSVSIPHGGDCYVDLSGGSDEDFRTIVNLGECGQTLGGLEVKLAGEVTPQG